MGKTFRAKREDNEGKVGVNRKKMRRESKHFTRNYEPGQDEEMVFTPAKKGRGINQEEI